jgi:hypothetical protein
MLNRLRRSALYEGWRAIRERQQVARISGLVSGAPYAAAGSDVETKTAIEPLRIRRRRVSASPNVVVFGANDWEQHGLWPAFDQVTQFSLFDFRAAANHAPACNPELAAKLGRDFLARVDEAERTAGPVEVVFIYTAGAWIDPAMMAELARRGIWTVAMSLDDKQQLPAGRSGEFEAAQLALARSVDVYWTTWRYGADWLAANGARPWYAAEGADPEQFAPRDVPRDIDVLWLGRAYGPRHGLVRWLRSLGFTVETRGPGWPEGPVPFDEMIELIARARVVLGMGGVGQTDRIKHLKGRDFEVPMCGAVYLTSFNPELTDHFDIGREILCYSSEVECAETLAYVLRRPALAESIRRAARARCVADHTWTARLERLIRILS